MKLRRIKLRNFRSHKNTVIALLRKVTFLRGLNRTGKTSIRMAIEMVLAGRCAVTDEDGKGFEQLIAVDAQTATIVLEFTEELQITLTLDRTNGRTLKVQDGERLLIGSHAQKWIAEHIAPRDIVSACIDATRFVDMSANDQAQLLARLLLPDKLPIDPEVSTWLAQNKLSLVEKSTLFATIEATFKEITSARTEVNRTIRDLKNIAEPEVNPVPINELEAKIRALETEQINIRTRIQVLKEEQRNAEQLGEQLAAAIARVASLKDKLQQLDAPLNELQRAELEKTANLSMRYEQLTSELKDAETQLKAIHLRNLQLDQISAAGNCPTCHQAISDEQRKIIFDPLLKEANDANTEVNRLKKELRRFGNPAQAIESLRDDNALIQSRQHIAELLENEQRFIKQNESKTFSPDAYADELSKLKAADAALQERKTAALEVLVANVKSNERIKEYNEQITKRTNAEERLAELERLLDYFGPMGIRAKLISERIDTFTSKINEVLAWWGYQIAFTIEPFVLKIAECHIGHFLSLNQLSASERYRLGIAFAHAIAQWSGFNFIMADAAEVLDKLDKWQLAQLLINSNLDQAVLLSTGIAGTFEAPGTTFYTLAKNDGITNCEMDAETDEAEVVNAGD